MSDTQPKRPAPPEGFSTWLDWATQYLRGVISSFDHARAELAELRKELSDYQAELEGADKDLNMTMAELAEARKELSDTQGLLATARENLVAIDAQRAEAVRERDLLRAHEAELRAAVLRLGGMVGQESWLSDRGDYIIRMQPREHDAWNALVARLRAEAKEETKR